MKKVFDEIFVDMTRFGTKIPTSEYSDIGKYIIVDQSQNQVAGYTDNEQGLFNDLPAIIFGDHTRVIKYVDKPFFLGADGTKILKSKLKNVNYKYLFYALQNAKIPNTGYNRHFKWLKSLKINYPSALSQSSTVMLLDKISHIIDCKKKKMDLLDSLVKARFVEMFGDIEINSNKYPTKKLGIVANIGSSHRVFTTEFVEKGIPFYRGTEIAELANGKKPSNPFYISQEHYNRLTRDDGKPQIGDLLMPSICNKGQVWMVDTEEPFYYKDGRVLCISPNRAMFSSKYFTYFMREKTLLEYPRLGSGSTFAEFKIFLLKDMDIIIPPRELQNSFANFISKVDKSKSSNTMMKNKKYTNLSA